MVNYAELADVRAEGNFSSSDVANNTQLVALIESVSRMMDAQLGTIFAPETDTTHYFTVDDLIANKSRDLFLGRHRLLTLTSIANADGTSIAVGDVMLLPQGYERKHTVRIKSTSNSSWVSDEDGEIAITGKWGYSLTVPADVKQMCVEWVIHVFNGRGDNGTSGNATIISPDGVVISPNSAPPRVRDFLKHSKYKGRV